MSDSKTRFSVGNTSSKNRTHRPKNIYQLDNFQRSADECELNYHILDFDYDQLLEYAELLNKYAVIPNVQFSEKDNLIAAVVEMEESIRGDGDYIDVSEFAFGTNHIIIQEACHVFYGSIFSYNLAFINWDIPKDIKIGLSKVFLQLYPFFGSKIMKNKFETSIKVMYDTYKENAEMDIQDELGDEAVEEFNQSYPEFLKYGKKLVAKVEKYAKLKFNSEFYSDPEIRIINEAIVFILSKDISDINILRSERSYNEMGGDMIPLDYVLTFTCHDFSEIMDKFLSSYVTTIVNEANECGGEMTYGRHKISKDGRKALDGELIDSMNEYEKKLTQICSFLTDKYDYE